MSDSSGNQTTDKQGGVSGSRLIAGGGLLVAIFIGWFVVQRFETPIDPPALWDETAVGSLESIEATICRCTDLVCLQSAMVQHKTLKKQYGGAPDVLRDRLRETHTAIEACRKKLADRLKRANP